MPAKQGVKLGGLFGDGFDQHKGDATEAPKGGGDLPPGINAGVAELIEIKGGIHDKGDNKGKPYVLMTGIVRDTEPEFRHCIGMRTSKIFGLYPSKDGKRTKADAEAAILNEIRLLGLETKHLAKADIDPAIEELVKSRVHFKFQTWIGAKTPQYPNPRTNHKWMGFIPNYTPGEADSGVTDNSGSNEQQTADEDPNQHWRELGEKADAGDADAENELIAAGEQYGVDTVAAASWSDAANAIIDVIANADAEAQNTEPDPEPNEPWKPKVGEVYPYRAKGARKDVDIEVTQVFSSTLSAKEVASKRPLKAIPWSSDPPSINGKAI